MKIGPRLAKLDAVLPAATAHTRSIEETRILIFELASALVKSGKFPHLQKRLAKIVDQTEAEIRRKAALARTDTYREHVRYLEEMWIASKRALPFVPPVLGSDHDDWFLPGLAARRLAVRRRPSVVALIGAAGSSEPECDDSARVEGPPPIPRSSAHRGTRGLSGGPGDLRILVPD